jgi:27-O-demethylrifamycin SV methyltransferase
MDNQAHYDRITDAWTLILGENLHYGYFTDEDQTLRQATDALVDAMASLAPIGPGTALLDVGCGIGTPAFRLAERTGCTVSAISVSARGLAIARQACDREGLSERVVFYQRDALDNEFPDDSFDVAWVMESSHLMRDKRRLCAENHRVLRPDGAMLLCDLILKRALTLADVYQLREELTVLERSFGKAKMETLDFYRETLRAAGFVKIECRDISDEVVPTLDKWEQNLETNRELLAVHLAEEDIDDFARSCEILRRLFRREVLGYGIVTGAKDGRHRREVA